MGMNLLAYRFKRTRFNRQTRIGSHGRNGVFGIDFVEKSIASLDEDCTYTAFGNIAKITDSLNFVVRHARRRSRFHKAVCNLDLANVERPREFRFRQIANGI